MKILHLNISDGGGGVGKAGYRLHRALKSAGVESWMLVDQKLSNDDTVITAARGVSAKYSAIRARLDKLPGRFCKTAHWEYASFNYLPNPAVKQAWEQLKPDVLHLHWIGDGFLPLQYFPAFRHIPTVATLHGRWLFNGAQHLHSDQSIRFVDGFLKGNRDHEDGGLDVDRWVWQRKLRYFRNHPFEVIALSNWMKRDAQRSLLLKDRKIHLIPNGLNPEVYHALDREQSRQKLGLPLQKPLILFGANFATQDRNKGFHYFVEAIRELERTGENSFEIVVFGSNRPAEPLPYQTKTHFLGYLREESQLVTTYSACDLFVLPSLQDNLPNTVMEAMACGTPSVAFNVGGVSDLVEHKVTGELVAPRNASALAKGIASVLEASDGEYAQLVKNCLDRFSGNFTQELQVKRLMIAYEHAVKQMAATKSVE